MEIIKHLWIAIYVLPRRVFSSPTESGPVRLSRQSTTPMFAVAWRLWFASVIAYGLLLAMGEARRHVSGLVTAFDWVLYIVMIEILLRVMNRLLRKTSPAVE